jgi:hypothetical protein
MVEFMSEPEEPVKQIEPAKWEEFLKEFSARNFNRRARFEIFSGGSVEEEEQEARLEEVSIKRDGKGATIKIIRIDRAEKNADKIKNEITGVRGISVQYETDSSENALEITDDKNNLISLRLESKVDGNS